MHRASRLLIHCIWTVGWPQVTAQCVRGYLRDFVTDDRQENHAEVVEALAALNRKVDDLSGEFHNLRDTVGPSSKV